MDLFNKDKIKVLEDEIFELRHQIQALDRFRALSAIQIEKEISTLESEKAKITDDVRDLKLELEQCQELLIETREKFMLQEVGIYDFSEIMDTAVAYQEQIKAIDAQVKLANKPGGGATTFVSGWTVNGSLKDGEKMVSETSKLMLRAYNGAVDDALRTLKPFKVPAAVDRLDKVRAAITKLGKTMQIEISPDYHKLRIREIKLTGDFLEKQAREKEEQKAIAQQLKDEAKAQAEFAAEKAKHLKELTHLETILKALEASGDAQAIEANKAKILEVQEALEGVEARVANIKQGFVYVISNIGSFGEDVIKIGLTRRINYEDRIRELSDASVPFVFDIHAVIASEDAVSLERKLHEELHEFRLNKVNARKEFFRATPSMVREKLEVLAGDHLLVFNEEAIAEEFRISIANSQS